MTGFADDPQITMAHGAGGAATRELIERVFLPRLQNPALAALGDAARLDLALASARLEPATSAAAADLATSRARLAFTTDSFVVRPLQFPGGSIGELAINGTLNDLAVSGARPLALSAAFILEAGLSEALLAREVEALALAARRAGVPVVTGDTKVVEPGRADGLYICTSGIGLIDPDIALDPARVRPGDQVLLSGPIGDHGVTILVARAELNLQSDDLRSDTRNLWPLVAALLSEAGPALRWMRDATRGGVATVLNELARAAAIGIELRDEAVPVRPAVRGACKLLGLDPLHVANEGQFVAIVDAARADAALAALHATPGGAGAVAIGTISAGRPGSVWAITLYGGQRAVDVLVGDPLPRIC